MRAFLVAESVLGGFVVVGGANLCVVITSVRTEKPSSKVEIRN